MHIMHIPTKSGVTVNRPSAYIYCNMYDVKYKKNNHLIVVLGYILNNVWRIHIHSTLWPK